MTLNPTAILVANFVLIIADASLGYHLAPFLMQRSLPGDAASSCRSVHVFQLSCLVQGGADVPFSCYWCCCA